MLSRHDALPICPTADPVTHGYLLARGGLARLGSTAALLPHPEAHPPDVVIVALFEHEVGPGPAREDVLAEVRAVDRAPDPSRRRLELVVAEGREVAAERRFVVERGAERKSSRMKSSQ